MQGIVPVKTGFLRDSVTAELTPNGFSVFPSATHAKFVDQPTRPHRIFPSGARVLRWFGGDGSPIFAAYVSHPGTKGAFFIKRTAEGLDLLIAGTKFDLIFAPENTPIVGTQYETWEDCVILSCERTAGESGGVLEKISGEAAGITLPA